MENVIFPMVMRVFSKTIAQDLIPVRPMDGKTEREREIEKREKKINRILDKIRKGKSN